MILYFKIGSMPGMHMRVVRKRKPPVVGERFFVRDPKEKYSRHEPVRLLEIRNIGIHLLYVVERF
jgi:hypothetical protein